MQTSIKVRRAWNTTLVAAPLDESGVIALNRVPGARSVRATALEYDGVVITFSPHPQCE